ncbi:MAG: transposase [Saprospiraceae bacterium]
MKVKLIQRRRLKPTPKNGKRGCNKKSKGLNLLFRMKEYKHQILEYAFNPDIPFTNNQSERDLRHCKVKLKVSGCFRSIWGAEVYARIIAFISTLKKNSFNLFDELSRLFSYEKLEL